MPIQQITSANTFGNLLDTTISLVTTVNAIEGSTFDSVESMNVNTLLANTATILSCNLVSINVSSANITWITNANLVNPTFSGTGYGSLTDLDLTTPLITQGTASADPTTSLGLATKAYVDSVIATSLTTTGDVKLTLKTTADTGWILMNDLTIGSAGSGATGRANADTSALYTLIWTNIVDQWAPVATGRGVSAAADFAANKALALPKTLGRAMAGYGTGTVVASGVDADVDIGAANSLTVASNNTKWITGMPVVFTLSSGTITGLTTSTTYYVIRSSSGLIKLASTLALAQAATEIDLTAKSSPVWTITHTYTARVLGESVGEQDHAMSSTELLAHTHNIEVQRQLSGGGTGSDMNAVGGTDEVTRSTGGNAAMNSMQPTWFLNVMVKL